MNQETKRQCWATVFSKIREGTHPSEFLVSLFERHVKGEIDFKEVKAKMSNYYSLMNALSLDTAEAEADSVILKTAEILLTANEKE